jgi:hypothetical protein
MTKLKNRVLKMEEKINIKNPVIPFIIGKDEQEGEILDKYYAKHPEDKNAIKIVFKLN